MKSYYVLEDRCVAMRCNNQSHVTAGRGYWSSGNWGQRLYAVVGMFVLNAVVVYPEIRSNLIIIVLSAVCV